jgi:hypothetical protein
MRTNQSLKQDMVKALRLKKASIEKMETCNLKDYISDF